MQKQEESLKFERTASGKYVWSFKLLGSPEDNLDRLRKLSDELNKQVSLFTG